MFRVTQFSDTHFTTIGGPTHGGIGYDTDETWEAVYAHAFGGEHPDLVVITGDLADRGLAEEYRKAGEQLARIPVLANVGIGNHDFHVPFEAHLPRPRLTMSRTLRMDNWLFLFADSNGNGKVRGDDGRWRDKPDRIHHRPQLGSEELLWLHDTIAATDAEHVFLWVHHPPTPRSASKSELYDAELTEVFETHDRVRGAGCGHTHTDHVAKVAGRPMFTCPAFTINLDYRTGTMLPPGYRTYEFDDDGAVRSTCHLLDDARWPRRPLPEPAQRWLRGEIDFEQMVKEMAAAG